MTWSVDGTTVAAHRLVMRVTREQAAASHTLAGAARRAIGSLDTMMPAAEDAWRHPLLMQEFVTRSPPWPASGHLPGLLDGQAEQDLLRQLGWAGWYLNEISDISRGRDHRSCRSDVWPGAGTTLAAILAAPVAPTILGGRGYRSASQSPSVTADPKGRQRGVVPWRSNGYAPAEPLGKSANSHEVGARLGAHFARGCSVVLGCARACSFLTWADGMSRRSGEWW